MPGNMEFWSNDIEKGPDKVKFEGKEKFQKHMFVWIAISERDLSKPLIRAVNAPAINQHIYLKECLIKLLLPFIKNHHNDVNYLFWQYCV